MPGQIFINPIMNLPEGRKSKTYSSFSSRSLLLTCVFMCCLLAWKHDAEALRTHLQSVFQEYTHLFSLTPADLLSAAES